MEQREFYLDHVRELDRFPGTGFSASCWTPAPKHARRIAVLQPVAMASILVYLFCLGVLVVMTIRPNHLLEFDYFTSILIPSIFLLMGLTSSRFRTPGRARASIFWWHCAAQSA